MTAWEGLNRRKFPRVNFPCLVTVQYSEDKKDILLTHTENIGLGGVCVALKKNLKMATQVTLELDLLDGDDHIECSGKIVWAVQRAAGEATKPNFFDLGIEFLDISEEEQGRIETTVARLARKSVKTS